MKIIKKINIKYSSLKILKKVKIKKFAKTLPILYLILVVLGLVLFGISKVFPKVDTNVCLPVKFTVVCTYLGLFVSVIPSLPGYVILGSVLRALYWTIPVPITYFLVLGLSYLVYFSLGKFIDNVIDARKDIDRFIKLIVIGFFVFLILGYFFLITI